MNYGPRKIAEKQLLASLSLSVDLSLCACPSAWNKSLSTGAIFTKFYIHVEEIRVSLKIDMNDWY